jgi:DNA gyrase/topoisomerase IV subunit A
MTNFGLSEHPGPGHPRHALQRLTGLERQKILDELAELMQPDREAPAPSSTSDKLLLEVVIKEMRERRRSSATSAAPSSSPRRRAISASRT